MEVKTKHQFRGEEDIDTLPWHYKEVMDQHYMFSFNYKLSVDSKIDTKKIPLNRKYDSNINAFN